jgi:integrase
VQPWRSRGHTLARHCRKLGLLPRNAIDLRHTAASWIAAREGISVGLTTFLGHSSPMIAARVYAGVLPPQLRETIASLESIADEREGRGA